MCKTVTRMANDVNAWDAHGFAHDEYEDYLRWLPTILLILVNMEF